LREIFVLDFSKKTVKANACVAGLGRTKQIFLSDTLVNDFSQGEVLAVLAHEMGHYVGRDTLKMSCVSLVSALASCYAASLCLHRLFPLFGLHAISDISGLPVFLIVMMGMGLVLLPLQNYFSRFLEVRADQFALATTKDRTSFISLMRRLGEKNFADFSPSQWIVFFLYDHPPLAQRIHMAEVSLC
jgi:STE24 endopeptidase